MRTTMILIPAAVMLVTACGDREPPPASETPKAPSTGPTVSDEHGALVPSSPPATPPTPVPEAPTPGELAEAALEAGRYADVCPYLVTRGFAADICEWIAGTAAGGNPGLPSRRLEVFLRAQHVRRVSGSIVGLLDRDVYDTRIGGRMATLETSETSYATTGHFSMWAQQYDHGEEELASGRTVEVPIYREWPLFDAITSIARTHSHEDATATARSVLAEILRAWETDYCYPSPDDILDCYVDPAALPVDAGASADGIDGGVAAVSDERRRECRRACAVYLGCRSLALTYADCREDMTPTCRVCRDEGAVR